MGLSFPFGKKARMQKLVGHYMKFRIKQNTAFKKQIELLDAQLASEQIDTQSYKRLTEVLEMQYYQKQAEEWTRVKSKFNNPLNS
jgi:hypothetical protein